MAEIVLKTKNCHLKEKKKNSARGRPVGVYLSSRCPVPLCPRPAELAGYCKSHYYARYRRKQKANPCLTAGCMRKVVFASRCRRCNEEVRDLRAMGLLCDDAATGRGLK